VAGSALGGVDNWAQISRLWLGIAARRQPPAAAATFGAYLRELGRVAASAWETIRQGDDVGRPNRIVIDVPRGDGPITVTGSAVPIRG
jgi:hypothetical protein